MHEFCLVLGVERRNSCGKFVQEDSESPKVCSLVVAFLLDELGSEVFRCSHHSVGLPAFGDLLGDSKVGHLDVSVQVQQDVLRFEISVEDSLLVKVLKSQQDLGCVELGPVLLVQLLFFAESDLMMQMMIEFPALHELHHQVDLVRIVEAIL